MLLKFQFPSNGKDFLNSIDLWLVANAATFQFPSNGKVFPNEILGCVKSSLKKFQFPSNGKVFPNEANVITPRPDYDGFNSLQTGRSFRTIEKVEAQVRVLKFQFPSNGKVFPNVDLQIAEDDPVPVSIPFKREGLSELDTRRHKIC